MLLTCFSAESARAEEPAAAPSEALPDPKLARPAALPPLEKHSTSWERLIDVGGDFVLAARPATADAKGNATPVRYGAASGFALHMRWSLMKYLQLEGYYVNVHMPVSIPRGGLGIADAITSPPVDTYVFGARFSPTITFGRVRAWVSAGAGWGRFEFRRMQATTDSGATYSLRERGGSFIEFPIGLGVSIEVVKRWLSVDFAGTAAFVVGQEGDAFDDGQTVDPAGKLRNVGPMPIMDASLVQTIGLSLLL